MSDSLVSGTAHRGPRVAGGPERDARAWVCGRGGGGVSRSPGLRSAGCRCSAVGVGSRCTLRPSGPPGLRRPVLGRGFESHHAEAQACSAGSTWWRLEEVAPGNGCRGTPL